MKSSLSAGQQPAFRNHGSRGTARQRRYVFATMLTVAAGVVAWTYCGRWVKTTLRRAQHGGHTATVEERVAQYEAKVAARLTPVFEQAGVAYPPAQLALLAFKDKREVEIHARSNAAAAWRHVKTCAVMGTSGGPGPKLAEGDRQVPEGVYAVEWLNPNSRFHLSLKLNYPNAWDRRMGLRDGRSNLGSDIMIHGGAASIGCLAMGDAAAEELFVLAALTGVHNVRVVISPADLRSTSAATPVQHPAWVRELYAALRAELAEYPVTAT